MLRKNYQDDFQYGKLVQKNEREANRLRKEVIFARLSEKEMKRM